MNHAKTLQQMIRLAAVLVLVCAAISTPPGRGSTPQAPGALAQRSLSNSEGRTLLDKVIKALGGKEKVQAVKSVRAKTLDRKKGAEGAEEVTEVETIAFSQPAGLWQKLGGSDPRATTLVFLPKYSFVTSFSEVQYGGGRAPRTEELTEEMPPSAQADAMGEMARDHIFVAQHADDPSFVFRAAGSAKVRGVDTEILDVSHPATDEGYPAADVRWFIDSEGRIVRATWEQSQADTLGAEEALGRDVICARKTEDYSDWRLVDGILFPFKETDTCEGGGKTSIESVEVKLFEVNPRVDPKILQWPGSVELPSASNNEGKALLAQVIQALGGEAKVRSVKSIRVTGASRVRGPSRNQQESESATLIVFPDWFWLRRPGPGRGEEMTVAASPQGVFLSMGNSEKKITREMPAWAGKAVLREMGRGPAGDEFIYVAQHAGDPNYIFYGAGAAKMGGIETRILDVSTPLTDVRWFVDPQTGRILRASWKQNKSSSSDIMWVMVTDYADWKSVNAIWFPFVQRTAVSPGRAEFTEFTASEIEVNTVVDIKIFAKPTYPIVELPELKELAGARSVRIQDDWSGLGPSRRARYELRPDANQLTGEATFSVGGLTKTESIQIPLSAVRNLFRTLGEASLEDREYLPRFLHTDDYPSLQVELDLGNKAVTFFTQSQGASHVPWALKFKEKTYVINSDVPARALGVLDPYLKRDVQKQLLEEFRALQLPPAPLQTAEDYLSRGDRFLQLNRLQEAISDFSEAIHLRPDLVKAHESLANTLRLKGDIAGAIVEWRAVLRLKPDWAEAHYNLGNVLKAESDLSGAMVEYREALRLKPGLAEAQEGLRGAHMALGDASYGKRDWERAIIQYQIAVQMKPDVAMGHFKLGVARYQQGDWDGAISEYREAIRLDPKNASAHDNLAGALEKKGDADGAIAEYREAVRLAPRNAVLHNSLGQLLLKKGDLDAAIAEFREATSADPKYAYAHDNLGEALYRKGEVKDAIAAYREAIRAWPKHALPYLHLGLALEAQGDRQAALEQFRAAYDLAPNQPEIHDNYERLSRELRH